MKVILASMCLPFLLFPAAGAHAADAAAGKAVFGSCMACHAPDDHTNRVGPHLGGVVGRKAASVDGYNYSPALKKAAAGGLVWTEANLDKWLTNPRAMVPGTKMIFPGIPNPTDRGNVIAYLTGLSASK